MTTYRIRAAGGRWSACMNRGAKLKLPWVENDHATGEIVRAWLTTDEDAMKQMRRLGAEIVEVTK